MDYHVHLVEDEENLAEVLKVYMEKEGWTVTVFHDGESAMKAVNQSCHLWVLDIMLPGIDGYEVLKKIKMDGDTPVIFISARDQDLDRIIGLELGSDDYLAKPFLPRELIIRAKKLLNRVYEQVIAKKMEVSGYLIDSHNRKIFNGNESIELTTKELDVVLLLVEQLNQTLAREDILYQVWGRDYVGSTRAVDDVVRRIRKKMPRLNLETLYGYGYRIVSS
ncbi:response regulator transcription factor [Bacillus taeanensis]|uniref:DNA-binding response regulator n=1 Tax=Bacillus taeanensis TaxID=273032 RepID=A0A366XYV0_9BACI|nr:response regulator transcription factor [Bacillus taeanensis]RBW69344.1 DNA-binding response regulator [Bacillus taeanensis]